MHGHAGWPTVSHPARLPGALLLRTSRKDDRDWDRGHWERTISANVAIGVGQEHEGKHGQDGQCHHNLGDHHQQNQPRIAVQSMRRYAQQPCAQADLIPPACETPLTLEASSTSKTSSGMSL